MKKKSTLSTKIWFYFVVLVFFTLIFTFMILMGLTVSFFRMEIIEREISHRLMFPFIMLIFLSVVLGTSVSLFVARKFLKPIASFSRAVNEVAKGNFSVRMDESERIREIRELTHDFNCMVHELSRVETLRSDFLDNASHEFKTPIAAINGYATLLQDKSLADSERDEYVKLIAEGSKRLSSLAENILNLSKLENQETILDKKKYRLDEQMREAVLLLENHWSGKNIEPEVDLEKIIYFGGRELLAQVWFNLLDNAVKYTDYGGKISIKLYKSESSVVAKISDTGVGIDEKDIPRIFEKFYQADKTRRDSGSGIGLALAKRIVVLCGGTIEARSERGKGSVFTVTLPDDR